jgi:MHS family alpha-ketoglutarate permease-like MFS transporter
MILFTALGAVASAPLLFALGTVTSPYMACVLVLIALSVASFYTSISCVVKAELFSAEGRALGVGPTNAIVRWRGRVCPALAQVNGARAVVRVVRGPKVAIGLVASLMMPDTRKYGYLKGTGQVER